MTYFGVVKKKEIDPEEFHDPIVLIGWPGIALIGKLAVSSIKDSIGAEIFMEIDFFDFPPKSNVEGGSLEIPSAQVYFKPRNEFNKKNDLFILTGDYQPQSSNGVFEFSKKFCDIMKEITGDKIKLYISTAALVTDIVQEPPNIHICGTQDDIIKSFTQYKHTVIMKNGVIAGANGILPAWAGLRGYAPGVCLLAETNPLPIMSLEPKASKALASLLGEYFSISIDLSHIDKKIKEMEDFFESLNRQTNSTTIEEGKNLGSDSYFR
ncbi:MAG: PAC2 family protein [Promethearchaeota archaeon]